MAAKNWRVILGAALVSLLINGLAIAGTVPPTQTTHFYGDADGDLTVSGLDLIVHKNVIAAKTYTYDTTQAAGTNTEWNTCDVDSDRACSGLDLIILKNAVAGNSNIIPDDDWVISNPVVGGLPTTVSPSSSTPFRIVVSSYTGTSGRPGITVVATIVSGGGSLGGRECNPIPGSRDQAAIGGATCALAVTQTDWTVSTADGLTESAEMGFSFNAPSTSDTTDIKFLVNGNPALDMPTVSVTFTVNTIEPDVVSLTCPISANEDSPFQCTITGSGPSSCTIGAATTCTGPTITGCTTVDVPAQGEAAGPGSCVVEVVKGAVSDNQTIAINEANIAPTITSTCPTMATEGLLYTCSLTATDPDVPPQTLTWTLHGSDTCGGTVVGSTYSWIPTEVQGGAGACIVAVAVSDGFTPAGIATQNTSVTAAEANLNPVITSTCATVATEGVLYTCDLTATDADLPAQTLTWSLSASDTCGGTITGSSSKSYSWTPSDPQGGSSCDVGVQVTDNFTPPGVTPQTTNVTVYNPGQCVIYVDDSATGANNGTSWVNAFTNIQPAVDSAIAGQNICVAQGTYKRPTTGAVPVVTMKNGVNLYGGFVGNETNLSQRIYPSIHPSVIDEESAGTNVVTAASNSRLDGFTVLNGLNGVEISGKTNFRVENCIIRGNSSFGTHDVGSQHVVRNVQFIANRYGAYLHNGNDEMENSLFYMNMGYGMSNYYGTPTIANVISMGNVHTSGIGAGGAYFNVAETDIWNSIIRNNTGSAYDIYVGASQMFAELKIFYSDFDITKCRQDGTFTVCTPSFLFVDVPYFENAPDVFDYATTVGTTTTVVVSTPARFTVGYTIEIMDDGVVRTVSNKSASTITFSPALATNIRKGTPIAVWGPGVTNITEDWHLKSFSQCVNRGDPSAAFNDPDGSRNDVGIYGGPYAILDMDYDGIPDTWEVARGLDPYVQDSALDPDGDGLANLAEYQNNTDPFLADTDFGLAYDSREVYSLTNPLLFGDDILPIPSAGVDQFVSLSSVVNLDGTLSADPLGETITQYTWLQAAGPATMPLVNANTATPYFNATWPGIYTFSLNIEVWNARSNPPDYVQVIVSP